MGPGVGKGLIFRNTRAAMSGEWGVVSVCAKGAAAQARGAVGCGVWVAFAWHRDARPRPVYASRRGVRACAVARPVTLRYVNPFPTLPVTVTNSRAPARCAPSGRPTADFPWSV